jgi:hypothetical protein
VDWYRQVQEGQASALASCLADLEAFEQVKPSIGQAQLEQAPASHQSLQLPLNAAGTIRSSNSPPLPPAA